MSNELIGIISDENFNVKVQITESGPQGIQGIPGNDGYTPIKGVDYFDGKDGEDGYTPIKGIDYFDGEKGDPFTYDDFTPEQLELLKGEKGDKGDQRIITSPTEPVLNTGDQWHKEI